MKKQTLLQIAFYFCLALMMGGMFLLFEASEETISDIYIEQTYGIKVK